MGMGALGKYELLNQIAVGGMAELCLARQKGVEGFEKLVVIKRILPSLKREPRFVQMFLDEAKLAAQFNHPNIIQIFDLGQEGDEFFIAMEFIHGPDLLTLVKKCNKLNRRIPVELVVRIFSCVLSGLHYAHTYKGSDNRPIGIVHRDISPPNIIISFDGGVKVVDFGIAKARSQISTTIPGQVKGKHAYMSPEQCRGLDLDARSDVFTVGINLFELLTWQRLFRRDHERDTFQAITMEPLPLPSSICPSLDKGLEAIILKALERDRERRFASAMEMQIALEDWVHSQGLRSNSMLLSTFIKDVFADKLQAFQLSLQRIQGVNLEKLFLGQTDKNLETKTVLDPLFSALSFSSDVELEKEGLGHIEFTPAGVVVRAATAPFPEDLDCEPPTAPMEGLSLDLGRPVEVNDNPRNETLSPQAPAQMRPPNAGNKDDFPLPPTLVSPKPSAKPTSKPLVAVVRVVALAPPQTPTPVVVLRPVHEPKVIVNQAAHPAAPARLRALSAPRIPVAAIKPAPWRHEDVPQGPMDLLQDLRVAPVQSELPPFTNSFSEVRSNSNESPAAPLGALPLAPHRVNSGWWAVLVLLIVCGLTLFGFWEYRRAPAGPPPAEAPAEGDPSDPAAAARPGPGLPAGSGVVVFGAQGQGKGRLQVVSAPARARIYLDGVFTKQKTPYTFKKISAGVPHVVMVELEGKGVVQAPVTLKEDEQSVVELSFKGAPPVDSGRITVKVRSDPGGASVVVNGYRLQSPTPLAVSLVGTKASELEVELKGYKPWKRTVRPIPGAELMLVVKLKKKG